MSHLTSEQLDKLTTPRLMALFKSVRNGHFSDDRDGGHPYLTDKEVNERWKREYQELKDYYNLIKTKLNTREHICKK